MGAGKKVTPADVEAAHEDQKRRIPLVSEAEALAATVVVLPDLSLRGWSGWLCKVCRRVPLPNRQPWSWFGCEACRVVDRRAAALFGGKRILPLGQHSIMNGIGIRLATPAGPGLAAKFDQFAALWRGWDAVNDWAASEGARLVAHIPEASAAPRESVPLRTWQEWFPPGREASVDAFVRLIVEQQPWLIDIEPRVGDVAWLAETDAMSRGRTCAAGMLALALALAAGCTGQGSSSGGSSSGGSSSSPVGPVEYDLGAATIVQQGFDADSRFRNMPVRLNGMIALPEVGAGPFPVVVVLHGNHVGCPTDDEGVDRWPCGPEVEQANYAGFGYLLEALAKQGYVALAPNLNAENTIGFGEPVPGERLRQVTDLHLSALAEAAAGGAQGFGVDLEGRADPTRLALIGHSRGGEAAVVLAGDPQILSGSQGYGPIAGTLLVAAATTFRDPWASIDVPVATILAGCDGDVTDQTGQFFFEGPRLAPDQIEWAASTFLHGASHNGFNSVLPRDMVDQSARADCQSPLDADRQQEWLAAYAGSFLALLFTDDGDVAEGARADLGLAVAEPTPDEVLGLPALVAYLAPADDRQEVLVPASAAELTTNLLGGAVTAEGLDVQFCPEGFYTSDTEPGTQACRRSTVIVPGQPALAVLTWESVGAALRMAIPEGRGDLSGARALGLRVAVDPASALNPRGQAQALTVQIADRSGRTAAVTTRPDEPALRYPAGEMRQDEAGGLAFFTGVVPFTDVRIPLSDFDGVDIGDIAEVAILLDQTPSGALFVGDVAFVAG